MYHYSYTLAEFIRLMQARPANLPPVIVNDSRYYESKTRPGELIQVQTMQEQKGRY